MSIPTSACSQDFLEALRECRCCPRGCGADRIAGRFGYCRTGAGFEVATIVAHRGEEPVISGEKGIANVFFSHCNMQCLYCQNRQISCNAETRPQWGVTRDEVVSRIEALLEAGVRAVGFVSPSHVVPQVKDIIGALRSRGHGPVFVYNSNGYERPETVRSLEGLIDVYLPDLKYMDSDLAARFSDAPGYPEAAAAAIREMYRQKGSGLAVGEDGLAESGLIIRHLILPGQVQNSKECLKFIAEELSPSVHVSLMAQYCPTPAVADHPDLGRRLRPEEYEQVLGEFHRLGFHRGWVQDLGSPDCYRPDFDRADPFG